MPADRLTRASLPALGFALAGLAISAYLTVEHYSGSAALACPENATINCAKVTTSSWSRLAGLPVAVLGLAYFVAMTLLVLPAAWHHRLLDPVRVLGASAGMATVVYLVWAELFRIDAVCLWCTAVHACTLGLLATVLWRTAAQGQPGRPVAVDEADIADPDTRRHEGDFLDAPDQVGP